MNDSEVFRITSSDHERSSAEHSREFFDASSSGKELV
jgi:hypothetical protein